MGIGIDESGKFYVISGPPSARHCHAGPFDAEAYCRGEARRMGLDGALVRLAGSTVVGGALPELGAARVRPSTNPEPGEFYDDSEAEAHERDIAARLAIRDVLDVLEMGARDAATAIKASAYSDRERAALVTEERRREKPRVTVLRALGVAV